ncbi:MAG: TonB-dependent receptor [Steroidobacteraceae bacterium]
MKPIRSLTAACPVALALALQGVAFAAEPASNSDNDSELALQEVTVTGSRIVVRDGYTAPTPVTVVSTEAILSGSPTANVSQYLNTMPVFAGSSTPQTNVSSNQSGNTRVNGLNLRSLGTFRTLLLVDGQRVVSSTQNGTSDLNSIPQQLIQRVEIVTGGASAVYGSDAVSGVVNVILDKGFNGIKAEVGAGITGYGDNPNGNIQFSAGTPFAGGRGHVLFSSEYNQAQGISGDGGRQWNRKSAIVVSNPLYTATSGLPQFLNAQGVGYATGSLGGLIFSGPLRGVAFGPGGQPYQYQFGSVINGQYMIGGEWQANDVRPAVVALENREERQNYLGRVDFDLTDTIKVFAQASWANAHLDSNSNNAFMLGSGPTIRIDNPYIPASVRARMVALNLTSFRIGTESIDIPTLHVDQVRSVERYTAGLSGKFQALGNEWSWETTYLWNASDSRLKGFNNVIKDKYALATDAVVHPVTGAIVCRSTLTDPTNGCSPFNPLGIGVASQAAINYVTGTSFQNLVQEQEVFDASVSGTLFNNWAGAVSLAGNIAHRKESVRTDLNTIGAPFLFANTGAVAGSYNVNEAALETLFPLIGGGDFIQSWDINAAARLTDYSTSGRVTTWKLGSSFASTKGFRVRGTLSRDIRAPGLNELFAGGTISNQGGTFDPFTNTTAAALIETRGNPDLTPEIATSKSVGVVVSPSFIPGFQASVDYWEVSLKDAITEVGGTQVLNLCYQGQTIFCSGIERDGSGVLLKVIGTSYNYAERRTRGVDLDVSYSPELENLIGGRLDLRANATFYLEGYSNNGLTPATDNVGVTNGLAKWRVSTTATYTRNALRGSLTARAFPKGLIATGAIECQTGCPASSPDKPTYDKAWLPGAFYLDGSLGYTFGKGGDRSWEAFFNVRNLLDRDPPPVNTLIYQANTLVGVYDYLGRQFRIGARIRM